MTRVSSSSPGGGTGRSLPSPTASCFVNCANFSFYLVAIIFFLIFTYYLGLITRRAKLELRTSKHRTRQSKAWSDQLLQQRAAPRPTVSVLGTLNNILLSINSIMIAVVSGNNHASSSCTSCVHTWVYNVTKSSWKEGQHFRTLS